jgi:cell division septum initiation protein DivIVA
MKNLNQTVVRAAVALALSASLPLTAQAALAGKDKAQLTAQATEIQAVRDQVQALVDRLNKLEASNAQLQQSNSQLQQENTQLQEQNAALKVQGEKIEKAITTAEKSRDDQSDAIAKTAAKVAAADWASKIKMSGDFRYRNESIQRDVKTDQVRDRIRARFGFGAKINDQLSVDLRLATGGDDPRSPNQTVGASGTGMARRTIGLDQYYATWKPITGTSVVMGRQPYPWFRPGTSLLNDGDINPEGVSVQYKSGDFFGSAFGIWLSEIATANVNATTGAQTSALSKQGNGANFNGAQVGYRFHLTDVTTLTAAAMYTNCGGCKGHQPYWVSQGSAATTSQIGAAANGNSVDANGNLLYQFKTTEGSLELNTKLFDYLPFQVFANYAHNSEASNGQDTAYTGGFQLGKASDKGKWEAGYAYERLEKDSYFGQFVDSDFAGGVTNGKGHIFRIGYSPLKNWTLNATYFINNLNLYGTANPATSPRDESYKRLQLDFIVKY